jgi:hypothetical protein
MSGLPAPNWNDDDAATFGEGVARCSRPTCRAPLVLVSVLTLLVIRCGHCGRLVEHHSIFTRSWFGED